MKTVVIRSNIFQSISKILPVDPLEVQHRDFVLDWIASGVEIFRTEKPATPPIHLVSYFLVVSPDEGKVLLVDHIKAELWLPTGGHVEPGEDPKEMVVREDKEEFHQIQWFAIDAILSERSDPHLGRLIQKLKESYVT